MTDFAPARRVNVPLLIGLAGGTGSGKTYSALHIARGLAGGKPFAGIDTENGRMNIYADDFPDLRVKDIKAPFRPSKYAEAVEEADKEFGVIVVDSASHEWYGDGGCLDWQEELMDGKESRRLMSWIEPKKAHKRMVTRLLQVQAHVVLCFRAEPKVDMVDDPDRPGKKKFVEKKSLTGLNGWIPIAEKNLPYELTASFLLMAETPGVPHPIKLPAPLKSFVPLDRPLSQEVGSRLAEWAAGAAPTPQSPAPAPSEPTADAGEMEGLVTLLLAHGRERGKETEFEDAIAANALSHAADPSRHVRWLREQVARFETPADAPVEAGVPA